MNYALISNGIIINIIWIHESNVGKFPNAVPLNDIPAGIGDTFDGEHFYRDGERILTEKEKLLQHILDAEQALKILGVEVY